MAYKSETERIQAILDARRPTVCPNCGAADSLYIPSPNSVKDPSKTHQARCRVCRKGFINALKDTIYARSRIPLGTWYEVIKLLKERPKVGYMTISRSIGVGKTYGYQAKRKIMPCLEAYNEAHGEEEKDLRRVRIEVEHRV